jgi:SH3 domain-containing protein
LLWPFYVQNLFPIKFDSCIIHYRGGIFTIIIPGGLMETTSGTQVKKIALAGGVLVFVVALVVLLCVIGGAGALAYRFIDGQNENQRLQIILQTTQTAEAGYFIMTEQSHQETLSAPTATLEPSPSATATLEPSQTETVTTSTPTQIFASISLNSIYLRAGPSTYHKEVAGPYDKGTQMEILGRYKSDWFYVRAPDGKEGWAYKDWFTVINLNTQDVPIINSVPTNPPVPTYTPLPTQAPTLIPLPAATATPKPPKYP